MTRTHRAGVCLLLMAASLLPSAWLAWNYCDMPQLGHFHDDEVYWLAGRSLAQGEGYKLASLPGQPWQTKYPPLYPLWLSLAWRLGPSFPGNLALATLLNWVLLAPLFVVSLAVFRDLGISRAPSWLLLGFLAVNPYLCFLSITLMAEVQFAVLALASLLAAGRAGRPGAAWWVAVAAGALGGAAYLSKAAGLALLASVPGVFLMKKQWRNAALFTGGMLPAVVGWNLWVRAHLPPGTDVVTLYYNNYLGFQLYNVTVENLARVVWHNLGWMATSTASLLVFEAGEETGGALWRLQLCLVLAAGAVSGLRRLVVRSGAQQYLAFAGAFCAMLLIWHYPPTTRFLFPLLPLLAAGAGAELSHLSGNLRAGWQSGRAGQRVAATVIGAGLVVLLGWTVRVIALGTWRALPVILEEKRELVRQRREAYEWIARNTPAEATFLVFNDPLLTLNAGRRGCRLPMEPRWVYEGNRQRLLEPLLNLPRCMRERGLEYLLVTASDYERDLTDAERADIAARVRATPELERVWEGPGAAVYRLRPSVSGAPPSPPRS